MRSLCCFALCISVLILPALKADSYTFSLIPSTGDVSGPAGTTVGWGYFLENDSSSDWLVTTDLQAGTFLDGTPNSVFDFPDLGPGQSVTVPFDPIAGTGVYQLTWDPSVPLGFTNTGTFELDAEWWSDDPLTDGVYLADAQSTYIDYSATVAAATTSAVPEPSSLGFCALALAGLTALGCRNISPVRIDTKL